MFEVLNFFLSGSTDEFTVDSETAVPPGGNIGSGGCGDSGTVTVVSEDLG